MPWCVRAATSTSLYGVTKKSDLAVTERRPPSQARAAVEAGSPMVPAHVALPPTRYGLVIADTLASRPGSMAQVRSALLAAGVTPAASRPASRPPGATLAARLLLSSAWQAAWCGESMTGQTQAICSGPARGDLAGQNGRKLRSVSSVTPVLSSTSAARG